MSNFNIQEINPILILVILWEAIWKGVGLWKSARNNQRNFFIAIFIVNSLGILPIIYLKFFQRPKVSKK